MPEYIKRESLIENLNKFAPEQYNALVNMLIEKQLAADVVEVVRCKDCEHRKEIPNCQKELYSSSCVACSYHSGLIMDENDFCSYGIKKEGTEE